MNERASLHKALERQRIGYDPEDPHRHQIYLQQQEPGVQVRLEQELEAAQQCINLLDSIVEIMVRAQFT